MSNEKEEEINPEENEAEEKINHCSFHPKSRLFQTIGLLFICSIGFGNYFCYDGPGALEEEFEHGMDMSSTEFGLLYTLYSWPNIVAPIVGGLLIDKVVGIRLGAIIFAAIIAVGQVLTATGAFLDSKTTTYIGRFVFGLGGENLAVACNTYCAAWFSGVALNFAFGFQLSIVRVGSAVSLMIMGPIYNLYLPDECEITSTTVASTITTLSPEPTTSANMSTTSYSTNCEEEENKALGMALAIAGASVIFSCFGSLIAALLDKRREKFSGINVEEQPKIRISEIKSFPLSFWLTSVVIVTFYVAIFPFVSFAQPFFKREDGFAFSDAKASFIQSMPYYMSAVLAPTLGFVIDRTGRNVAWVLFSCVCTLIAHCILVFQSSQTLAYVAMAIMGVGYSTLASSLWPVISLVIPIHRQGTAYGVTQAIQNLGLGLISLLAGYIKDADVDDNGTPDDPDDDKPRYVWLEIFYIAWVSLAVLFTGLMWFLDFKQSNYLCMSDKERKKFQKTPEYFKYLHIEMPSELIDEGKVNDGYDPIKD